MANSRKDSKGRVLRTGEAVRSNGLYQYSYTDPYGKRRYIYAKTLVKLRQKEDELIRDRLDGIHSYIARDLSLNDLFDKYMNTRKDLSKTTYAGYMYQYNIHVRSSFGKRNITTIKVTVRVDKIKVADDLQLLDNDKIPDAWKTAVDANGKLVQNHLSYMKKGDGVNNLDSVVREENMNQKLLLTTVTYTNTSEEELNHMIYMGTLIALSKQDDGTYTIYMPGTEAGTDYDYYISNGVAKTAEMTYCSVQDDYGNGKNYIPSLKPGESVQVNMAWIVNEKDLENLYLNLNDTGGPYEISEDMRHTGVVYVGKE